MVFLTKEMVAIVLSIQIGETIVLTKPAVKYLGIMLDTKISFFEQIRNTEDRVATRISSSCRLLISAA